MTSTTIAQPTTVEPAPAPLELSWAKTTTPLEALERTLYALAEQVSGAVEDTGHHWRLVLHPRATGASHEKLAHQVRQQVTDQTLRVRIAERTDPVRNLVFAVAFSRSGLGADTNAADQR